MDVGGHFGVREDDLPGGVLVVRADAQAHVERLRERELHAAAGHLEIVALAREHEEPVAMFLEAQRARGAFRYDWTS